MFEWYLSCIITKADSIFFVKSFVLNKGLISLFLLSFFFISFNSDLLFAILKVYFSYSFSVLVINSDNPIAVNKLADTLLAND